MRKLIRTACILLLSVVLLADCTPLAPAAESEVMLVDGLGKQFALDKPAEKIVSLSPPLTEILFAVGAGEQVIARDSFSDYPPAAQVLPDIGGGYSNYDLESILSLEPDLVIAGSINTPEMVQSLQDLGLTVFYLSNPADLDGTLEAIQTLGSLSGHSQEARELADELQQRMDAVALALENIEEMPQVYYELDATDPAKPYTPGPHTFYSDLISKAGGTNIGDTMESEWAQVSLEHLLLLDPDIIILGDAMWGVTPESLLDRPGWDALSAVKSGQVMPFDDNLIARFGPRQVDGLEQLAKILHPEKFD